MPRPLEIEVIQSAAMDAPRLVPECVAPYSAVEVPFFPRRPCPRVRANVRFLHRCACSMPQTKKGVPGMSANVSVRQR